MTRFMGENQPGELRLFNIKKEGEQSNYIYIETLTVEIAMYLAYFSRRIKLKCNDIQFR